MRCINSTFSNHSKRQTLIKEIPLSNNHKIAILGAGAWGSALALAVARQGSSVSLWSKDHAQVAAIAASRINAPYLPDCIFPNNITVTADLPQVLAAHHDCIIAVPSIAYQELLTNIKPLLSNHCRYRFLSATKGMDINNNFLYQTFNDIIGNKHAFGIITGPSFAQEVAHNLPTALLIASKDPDFATTMCSLLSSTTLAVSISDDIIGAAVVGIIKNVVAIAVGVADGLSLGANARSVVFTKGFHEMLSLTIALGGTLNTCTGIAGIGDLVLTCHSDLSRNRRFGLSVGSGQDTSKLDILVEGVANVGLISNLAQQLGVATPVCQAVYDIVHLHNKPATVMQGLLAGITA